MILIGKSVGIDEIGINTPQFLGSFIHDRCKVLPGRSGNMLCYRERNFIGGADQNGIQTFLHGQLLAGVNSDMVASGINIVYRIIGEIHDLIHAAALGCDQCCQNFGGTGRVFLLMDIFGIKDRSGIRIHQNGGFCADYRSRRPVCHFIGLNGQCLIAGDVLFFDRCSRDTKPLRCKKAESADSHHCPG